MNATIVRSALATHQEHHACKTNASIELSKIETLSPAPVRMASGSWSFCLVSSDQRAAMMPRAK